MNKNITYKAIDALPGYGKTHSTIKKHIEEVSQELDKVLILAMPHITTLKEKKVLAHQLRGAFYSKSIIDIHSENTSDVGGSIIRCLEDKNVGILLCTHDGLIGALEGLNKFDNLDIDIMIDEETEAVINTCINLNQDTWNTQVLNKIDVLEVQAECIINMADNTGRKDLDKFYQLTLKDDTNRKALVDEASSDLIKDFWKRLISPYFITLMPKDVYEKAIAENQDTLLLQAVSIIDGSIYQRINPTFSAAFFKDTVFYNILQQQGIGFEFITPDEVIARDNKDRTITMKVYTENENLSQKFLTTGKNQKLIQERIATDIPSTSNVYYILNKKLEIHDTWQGKDTYQLASKFEGSNRYTNCDTCIFLAGYNLTPQMIALLKDIGIDPNMINKARNNIKAGQFMRGVNRLTDTTHTEWTTPFTIYIPTKEIVDFLQRNNFKGYSNINIEVLHIHDLLYGTTPESIDNEKRNKVQRETRLSTTFFDVFNKYPSKKTTIDLLDILHNVKAKTAFNWAKGIKPTRIDKVPTTSTNTYNKVSEYLSTKTPYIFTNKSMEKSESVYIKGLTLFQPQSVSYITSGLDINGNEF